jgi:hypothetical protein
VDPAAMDAAGAGGFVSLAARDALTIDDRIDRMSGALAAARRPRSDQGDRVITPAELALWSHTLRLMQVQASIRDAVRRARDVVAAGGDAGFPITVEEAGSALSALEAGGVLPLEALYDRFARRFHLHDIALTILSACQGGRGATALPIVSLNPPPPRFPARRHQRGRQRGAGAVALDRPAARDPAARRRRVFHVRKLGAAAGPIAAGRHDGAARGGGPRGPHTAY